MATRCYPRVFVRNPEDVSCQIIRNERERKTYNKIPVFRRCLIEDLDNFKLFQDGKAPYNQDNIHFAIENNLYEAFTGYKMD